MYNAHNVKMPTFVFILTLISIINTLSECIKQLQGLVKNIFQYFSFHEQFNFCAQFS